MTFWNYRNKLDRQLQSYKDFFHLIPDNEGKDKMLSEMVNLKSGIMRIDRMNSADASEDITLYNFEYSSIILEIKYPNEREMKQYIFN